MTDMSARAVEAAADLACGGMTVRRGSAGRAELAGARLVGRMMLRQPPAGGVVADLTSHCSGRDIHECHLWALQLAAGPSPRPCDLEATYSAA